VQLRLFGSTHREHSLKSRMARGRQAVPLYEASVSVPKSRTG
jgi:hypothetical protein